MSPRLDDPWYLRLLEINGILDALARLAVDLTRESYDGNDERRWAIHRLWIAVGVEAGHYQHTHGAPEGDNPVWEVLYQLRNHLAHQPLPSVDEDRVWRLTTMRLPQLRVLVDHLTE